MRFVRTISSLSRSLLSRAARPGPRAPRGGCRLSLLALEDRTALSAPYPLAQTFQLHSLPGATKVIYLDFDGNTTSGTAWNAAYTNGAAFTTPAYSFEGDASFSDAEKERIQDIWDRVREDYAPFNVDVTTQDPGVENLRNTNVAVGPNQVEDTQWGTRVVIGGSYSDWYHTPAGGVSIVNSFGASDGSPAFVFSVDGTTTAEKPVAEAISHEAGHTLGLYHDGYTDSQNQNHEYYLGQGSGATGWAPIMGTGYYQELTQWSKGEYAGANNHEDDLAIIATRSGNGFGYRPDDHGDTLATAATFNLSGSPLTGSGIIEQNTDKDVFQFYTDGTSAVTVNVNPAARGPNLDIQLRVFAADGTLVGTYNPTDALNVSQSLTLAAGVYYLEIDGVGKGNPLVDGYTDYGSLGAYTIAVTGPVMAAAPDSTVVLAGRTFTLTPQGNVYRQETGTGPTLIATGITQIGSGQGALFALRPNGQVLRYNSTSGQFETTPVATGITQVASAQGQFFAFNPGGTVYRYSAAANGGAGGFTVIAGADTRIGTGQGQFFVQSGDGVYRYSNAANGGAGGFTLIATGVSEIGSGRGQFFVMHPDGSVYRYNDAANGFGLIATGVSQIASGQGQFFVLTGGGVNRYSDTANGGAGGFVVLTTGIAEIASGQGQLFLLHPGSGVYRYNGGTDAFDLLATGASQIASGQGQFFLRNGDGVYRYNNTANSGGGGFDLIATGVSRIGSGQGQFFLLTGTTAFRYNNQTGTSGWFDAIASGVSNIGSGRGEFFVQTGTSVYRYNNQTGTSGWFDLVAGGVSQIGSGQGQFFVLTGGGVYQYTSSGFVLLISGIDSVVSSYGQFYAHDTSLHWYQYVVGAGFVPA